MWADYLNLAFRTFMAQKKRTFLTLLGIFIGIAAVVSLISLGQGLESSINKQFDLLGTDKIFITPGSSAGFDPSNTMKLSSDDLDAVKSISGVESASGAVYKIARVKHSGEVKYTWVIGIDDSEQSFEEVMESFGAKVDYGRGVEGSGEAWVPYNMRTGDFFTGIVDVGDRIEIEGTKFTFVGAVNRFGNPQDDSQIFIRMEDAQSVFGLDRDQLDYIFVTAKEGTVPSDVAGKIKRQLRKVRDVKEGDEDFTVQTSEEAIASFSLILTVVQIVLIGIASISLLVGGVNIGNTMYTAVMERTREIGIMKAIGARNSDVFLIFLIESGLLGAAGGIIGIIIGISMSKLVSLGAASAGWTIIQTVFPWYLTVGAFLFSFVVGALAGTLPAIQAAKLKPVDALRYE
jgi:putative ABC transport system permease protein